MKRKLLKETELKKSTNGLWGRLLEIRKALGKSKRKKKSSVEILSEMRR